MLDIAKKYALGSVLTEQLPVHGGLIHRLWRLQTATGKYAVKILNARIMQQPGMRQAYEGSEQIARDMAARGIPAVPALTVGETAVQDIGADMIMVYPWIDGKVLSSDEVEPSHARRVGMVLGKIHSLGVVPFTSQTSVFNELRNSGWETLIQQAEKSNMPFGQPCEDLLGKVAGWAADADLVNLTKKALASNTIVSHCDITRKNVLWSDCNSPMLIDWEGAGPVNPSVELASLCLDWSGLGNGPPDRTSFLACLDGYRQSNNERTKLDPPDVAVAGVMSNWLNWLMFNFERSTVSSDTREHETGVCEIQNTIKILYMFSELKTDWISWLS